MRSRFRDVGTAARSRIFGAYLPLFWPCQRTSVVIGDAVDGQFAAGNLSQSIKIRNITRQHTYFISSHGIGTSVRNIKS